MQHRRDDPGRAIGGRGDHAAAGRVLLVHRQRVEVDPVQHRQRVAHGRFRLAGQLAVQRRRAARDVQATRQGAFLADAAGHARLHRVPDRPQPVADLVFAAPGLLVLEHQRRDAQAAALALGQQLVAALERVRQRGLVGHDAVRGRIVLVDHEAAADGVVVAGGDDLVVGVIGGEAHAVGVVGQLLPLVHQQVALLVEGDRVRAAEQDALVLADALQRRRDEVRVDLVGVVAFQAHQHGLVGAVAAAGQGQRAEHLGTDAHHVPQAIRIDQPAAHEARRRPHRTHRVRGAGTDADLEQVERTDCHAANHFGKAAILSR